MLNIKKGQKAIAIASEDHFFADGNVIEFLEMVEGIYGDGFIVVYAFLGENVNGDTIIQELEDYEFELIKS